MPSKKRNCFNPCEFPYSLFPCAFPCAVPEPIKPIDPTKFDYIVIGAGTAGGVIAKELTDDKSTSVLVLEAGTNMTNELSNPSVISAINTTRGNRFSFNVTSELESTIARTLIATNGRAIGGSSEISDMYAVRGSKELYNQWASLVGNQWSYDKISSLFVKNETYTGSTQDPDERGSQGPIFIRQQSTPPNGLINTLVQATNTVLGTPIAVDYNTGIRDCTFYKSQIIQKEISPGQFVRSSTATGYLNDHIVSQGNQFHPDEFGVGGRKLVILAKTTVNKILFKKKNGLNIAVGVEFVKDGVSHRRFARKGIIVSAGFFSSVILQRSGIGKSDDLAKAGIPTFIESPNVGHNLQTHGYVGLGVEIDTSQILPIFFADPNFPLILGAFQAENPMNLLESRRLQLIGAPIPFFIPAPDVISNGWSLDLTFQTTPSIMSFGIVDVNTKSRGTVLVEHSDPEAYPSLNFNPLEDPNDLTYMVDQYKRIYNIIVEARDPLKYPNNGIGKVVYPPESIFQLPDNDPNKQQQLENYVKASYTNFSLGGQCRMGQTIQGGVVDGFLNVFGTKNLKVADLSISPIIPDGQPSAAAQMIGLNAVRFIKEDPSPYVMTDKELEDYENEIKKI
ncbi:MULTISPECIES: GMC family oxidoreductase [Bacillus cereus group]|uniref:GMC family oxidoreductase n=1 Tax=Bacillus cereus group TaxID=86661 RepID=UPI000BEC7817|nr:MULTISPECIES: GMC family oxidoreductase [Bacillus cereus group]MBJ8050116.1 GMC family oxidoreductase [Bacillus cereus group sp. N18]PEA65672.1 oxidoreductase [Bacillus toyonensis]PGA39862.1 oxidoreductase [Bacillus toyonensis]PGC08799.1 oxidoreductase [Bacillus toyonensis]HDR7380345.1 GMC family oxidoreductase [Bacillus toyonensis]